MFRSTRSLALIVTLITLTLPAGTSAQLGRLRQAAQGAVEREATNKITTAIGEAVACTVGDTACVEKAQQSGDKVVMVDEDGEVVTDENGTPVSDPAVAEASLQKPGEGRWASYDFLRGERPIFNSRWNLEDVDNPPALKPNPQFRVGRIPGNVEFVAGSMELVQIDGLNTLEIKEDTYFRIPLAEPLPEDFSLEFTMKLSVGSQQTWVHFQPYYGEGVDHAGWPHHYLTVWNTAGIYIRGSQVSGTEGNSSLVQQLTPVKFQVDDGYAILYVAGERIAQVPNFEHVVGSNTIEFDLQGRADIPIYIRDIRVDYGVDDPVSVFESEGEYTTRSIYFDYNSADLRPESTPELERLRTMIAEYGQPLVIEGHTDSTGSDTYNMELSLKRAEAVKAYLVEQGIDAGLLEAVGKGETEPIADNATDDGRQANRRVRIVPRAG